jgi:polyisoprenoid-binding protein YceI
MRQIATRPRNAVVAASIIAAIVIVGAIAASIYIFGGGGGRSNTAANSTVTVPTLATSSGSTIFIVDGSSSKATFTIDEVLFGSPNTVVGQTNQVAGQILVNQQDPSQSQLGEIKVNLSTLVTDNDLRNHTLQGRILETSQSGNQYATFVAKSITGLPSSIAVGQQVSFKITGDLTVHGVTKTATFDAQVKVVSAKQLTGQAQTTVKFSDFNISIPNVPSVSNVGESVKLAIAFTANAK